MNTIQKITVSTKKRDEAIGLIGMVLERDQVGLSIGHGCEECTSAQSGDANFRAGSANKFVQAAGLYDAAIPVYPARDVAVLVVAGQNRGTGREMSAVLKASGQLEFSATLGGSLLFGGTVVARIEDLGLNPKIRFTPYSPHGASAAEPEFIQELLAMGSFRALSGFGMSPRVYAECIEPLRGLDLAVVLVPLRTPRDW